MDRVAIVGASAAGLSVAQSLRDEGYAGRITVVGEEARAFYDRPPLSKGGIADNADPSRLNLIDADALADLDLDLRLGCRAIGVGLADKSLALDIGASVAWDRLVVATGVSPVRIGDGLTLRTLDDAKNIGNAFVAAKSVVIIGAGILGCELAALAASQGKRTTVLDPFAGPMIDRLGAQVAKRVRTLHEAHGVDFQLGGFVESVATLADGSSDVTMRDGRCLSADVAIVAVGCRPATRWLADSGIPLGNGVECDELCRAAPDVYAAGDVANWFNPRFGRRMRIEHRTNATEQGMAVAENLLGAGKPFDPVPFFWTDQYDTKIQVYGMVGGDAELVDIAGDRNSDTFVVGYRKKGRIEGVLGWNMPRDTRKARALVGQSAA